MRAQFTRPRFILCEGDDDKGFLETLIAERQLPEFQVCHSAEFNEQHTGGRTGFVTALRGIEPLAGFRDLRALLIVTDNDVADAAFSEAQEALTRNGYFAPRTPADIGRLAGKPVAILMIPSAETEGNLETLCLPAIHDKWPKARECVHSFLECTGANSWTKKSSLRKATARAAAVGFNEPDPFQGIGHLFRHKTLSVMHPCFDRIAEFLQNFDRRVGIVEGLAP